MPEIESYKVEKLTQSLFEISWLVTPDSEKVENIEKYQVMTGPATKRKHKPKMETYELTSTH